MTPEQRTHLCVCVFGGVNCPLYMCRDAQPIAYAGAERLFAYCSVLVQEKKLSYYCPWKLMNDTLVIILLWSLCPWDQMVTRWGLVEEELSLYEHYSHLLPMGGMLIMWFNHQLEPLDDSCNDCKHGRRSAWWGIGGFPALVCDIFSVLFVLGRKSFISKRPTCLSRCSPLREERRGHCILAPSGSPLRVYCCFIMEQHHHTAILRWRSQIQERSKGNSVQAARNQTGSILPLRWLSLCRNNREAGCEGDMPAQVKADDHNFGSLK